MEINTIVFDFGGVLIDWNPRHLFRKVITDEKEMETFLADVCNDDWNVEQDRGRTLAEGTKYLVAKHPEKEELISMFYGRWTEMLNGEFAETVQIFKALKKRYKVYGLTNWSAETYPIAQERFDFLKLFDGIVVSGHEKLIKPEKEIFELLQSRFGVVPEQSVFIDDNFKNIEAARKLNFNAIHYKSPEQLAEELKKLGVAW